MCINRRQLLRALGAGALYSPVDAVVAGIAGGISLQARAQTSPTGAPKKYLIVYLEAGPSRWAFDQVLIPKAGMPFARNPGLNNAFDAAGQPTYLAAPLETASGPLNMPILWHSQLPRPDGSKAPMAELLNNAAIIRGYDMLSDGHQNNRIKQIYPLTGAPSLNGLVADSSAAPLPAVTLAGGFMDEAFFSAKGVGQLQWNPGDTARSPLQQFLDPFQLEATTTQNPQFASRKALDTAVEAAIEKLNAASSRRMPGLTGLFQDRANARKLLNTALGDLAGDYNTRLGKYSALIAGAHALDIPNVSNAVVNGAALQPGHRSAPVNGTTAVPLENPDLRSIFNANTTVQSLAEGFATADYLFEKDYGSAVLVTALLPLNLTFIAGGVANNVAYSTDEHLAGTAVSILVISFYYRAVAACIYELIQQLKARGQWENTVIHICSEFSRSPRTDGTGSDHGFEANVTTLLSGQIKKPLILGNVRVNSSAGLAAIPAYAGTWGAASPVSHDKTVGHLNIGHVTSSVAALLGVDKPMKNFSAVITVSDSGVEPAIGEAQNA